MATSNDFWIGSDYHFVFAWDAEGSSSNVVGLWDNNNWKFNIATLIQPGKWTCYNADGTATNNYVEVAINNGSKQFRKPGENWQNLTAVWLGNAQEYTSGVDNGQGCTDAGLASNLHPVGWGSTSAYGRFSDYMLLGVTYTNTIIHKKSDTKDANGNYTNWYEVERTSLGPTQYGATVTISSDYNKNYTGYSTGTTCWTDCDGGWVEREKGSTFEQPNRSVQIDYYYTPNQYTVTFDANDGTIPAGGTLGNSPGVSDLAADGKTATLQLYYNQYSYYGIGGSNPTRSGYTFTGWYDNEGVKVYDSSTASCVDGKYWDIRDDGFGYWVYPGNVTLYAHWTPNQYTVTFDANGGSVSQSSKYVTYDSTYGYLPTPSRTGYTFNDWRTADGTAITSLTKVSITSNQTLYAHWQEDYVTITFDANGGECSETTRQILRGHSIGNLPEPNKVGHAFNGWYLLDVKVSNRAKFSEDCTVTAHWTQNIYTLTYHANDGSNTTTSRTFTNGETFNLSTEGITREGFYITGWTYSQDDISDSLQPNHEIDGSWDSNIDLYAQWAPNTLTINYYSNFATSIESKYEGTADSVDPSGQTLIYTWVTNYAENVTGDTLHNYSPADKNTFGLTRIGYDPTGYWGNESSGGKTLHEESSFNSVAALAGCFDRLDDFKAESITINLYAQWVPKTYKITYHRNYSADDETCVEKTVTYMSNSYSEWGLPTEWARDGYSFKGYVDKLEGDDQETVYFENGRYNPHCSYWSDTGLWLGTSDIDVYVVWELLELGVSNLRAYWSDDGKILNVKMDKQYDNTVSIKIGTSGSLAQPNDLSEYISITDDAFSYEPTDLSNYMFQHIVVYNTKDGEIDESVHCCISNKIQTK